MGSVAVSNTFANDTVAEAPQVNTNFSDLVNYINARNSGSSKWDAFGTTGNADIDGTLSVLSNITGHGNATIDGTLSVSGTDIATAIAAALSADGWISPGETWTYASATTFTISGDKTSKYSVGDKIKLTQTTPKYFYIIGVSYSAPNTTITVCAGNVYSLANAAITSPYYSKVSTPNGFPGYFTFTPTNVVGFSGTPTILAFFSLNGRFINIGYSFTGTSNSQYISVDVPFTTGTPPYGPLGTALGNNAIEVKDNGVWLNSGYAYFYSNVIECWPSVGNPWTASGSKKCLGYVSGVL